jgi:hypothetical protein
MAKQAKQSVSPPPGQIKHDDYKIGTLDPSSHDTNGNIFVGTGNTAANYNVVVDDKADIELGLKIHYRQGPDILPTSVDADGTAYYDAPAGTQPGNPNRAAWNFDFSVNTGIDGSTKTLDQFDFKIIITSGDGEVGIFDMQHLAAGSTPWVDTPATGGFLDEDGLNPQLSQNSVNLGFNFLKAIFGTDALDAGETYDIKLQAFDDHGKIIAQVHDVLLLV